MISSLTTTQHNITGAGVYVTRSISYAGRQAAQPSNTYIIVDTGNQQHSDYIRLKLYCCSNATSSNVGSFTFPNSITRTNNYNHFRITRFSSSDANAGCIFMDIYYYQQRNHCYYTYDYWYGSRRVCETQIDDNFVLESSQIGVYTCNIPDVSGNTQRVHFAMYSQGSKYYYSNIM